jgi:hypothetical protein
MTSLERALALRAWLRRASVGDAEDALRVRELMDLQRDACARLTEDEAAAYLRAVERDNLERVAAAMERRS